jgi:hypothetical protein
LITSERGATRADRAWENVAPAPGLGAHVRRGSMTVLRASVRGVVAPVVMSKPPRGEHTGTRVRAVAGSHSCNREAPTPSVRKGSSGTSPPRRPPRRRWRRYRRAERAEPGGVPAGGPTGAKPSAPWWRSGRSPRWWGAGRGP